MKNRNISNKIDVMFVLDATPKRALAIDFPAQPLLYYALAVLADDEMNIQNWSDLNNSNVKLSVTQGTTMDIFVTKHLPKATILRFPSNGESVAAFQSRRVNAVSLFHPPLIAMRKKIGRGQIVLPAPVASPPVPPPCVSASETKSIATGPLSEVTSKS